LDKSAPNYDRIVRYLKAISTDVTALLAASRQGLDQGLTEEAGEYAAEGRLEEVDVAVLLSTAIGRIGLPPGISIDNRRCLETLKVLVPGDLIVETFENLIRNGVEAIEEAGRGGIVTLSCQEFTDDTGEYVRVDIHDNGCGISPENMSRVGTPGFTTKPRASGFAIWRAKALMESLEGRLTISSDPGKGTTVSILLPAQKKARG
jgi:signal transduction histidine kinase